MEYRIGPQASILYGIFLIQAEVLERLVIDLQRKLGILAQSPKQSRHNLACEYLNEMKQQLGSNFLRPSYDKWTMVATSTCQSAGEGWRVLWKSYRYALQPICTSITYPACINMHG